jgi:hypothetical protein
MTDNTPKEYANIEAYADKNLGENLLNILNTHEPIATDYSSQIKEHHFYRSIKEVLLRETVANTERFATDTLFDFESIHDLSDYLIEHNIQDRYTMLIGHRTNGTDTTHYIKLNAESFGYDNETFHKYYKKIFAVSIKITGEELTAELYDITDHITAKEIGDIDVKH